MTVYVDSDYKCHASNPDGAYREVDADFFDGKCTRFIEGYRFIPAGETWTRSDGVVFTGEMASPWKDYTFLAAYQEQYEESQAEIAEMRAIDADKTAALHELGVFV